MVGAYNKNAGQWYWSAWFGVLAGTSGLFVFCGWLVRHVFSQYGFTLVSKSDEGSSNEQGDRFALCEWLASF